MAASRNSSKLVSLAQRAEDGEVVDTEIAEMILVDLAALVRSARRRGQDAYCWVA
ncbi:MULTISPECIES: hypothetical protein [unclassified Streptomyces]|uniref:hypothetical protein n=1 Tax=unclassified Streptomyces TaxID=2593676 RepID=UPI0027E147B1|nr:MULTISPECIES: hypothetical protein [unclassified Streptomyces]MDU0299382.1 hypothetical protein [Streptomyces sp. PAL114]